VSACFLGVSILTLANDVVHLNGRITQNGPTWTTISQFTVVAAATNALIEIVYHDGSREICGSDGSDSYVCYIAPPSNLGTQHLARAFVSIGQYPRHGSTDAQVLWLAYIPEPRLRDDHNTLPFQGCDGYSPEDMRVQVAKTNLLTGLPEDISWRAPGELVDGTNRYGLVYYPNGYIQSRLLILETTSISGRALATRILYQQFDPENPSPDRTTNEVSRFQIMYEVTNIVALETKTAFLPPVKPPGIRVTDSRFTNRFGKPVVYQIASGEWVLGRHNRKLQSLIGGVEAQPVIVYVILAVMIVLLTFPPLLWLWVRHRRADDGSQLK
jgi:hypothetical protein